MVWGEEEVDDHSPRHQQANSLSSPTGLSGVSSSSPAGASESGRSTANASNTVTTVSMTIPVCTQVCKKHKAVSVLCTLLSTYPASFWCWC